MTLSLRATIAPDRLPDEPCDVELRFVLRNDGREPATVHPNVAKLAAIASYAGIGIAWNVGFFDADDAAVPIQELRTWYGPPGNPPAPSWVVNQAVSLPPGGEHETALTACWIPRAALEPRHLSTTALDPQGMDNVASSPHASHPPLAARVDLSRVSVVVLQTRWTLLAKARAKDDFLRGHVVAFFSEPGAYQLRVAYMQTSWMGIGTALQCTAAPVSVRIG